MKVLSPPELVAVVEATMPVLLLPLSVITEDLREAIPALPLEDDGVLDDAVALLLLLLLFPLLNMVNILIGTTGASVDGAVVVIDDEEETGGGEPFGIVL